MTREEAYKYLLETEKGEREDIIEKIGKDLFNELRLVGFIKEGMDGKWIQRWKTTSFGIRQMRSYVKFSETDKELDDICSKLKISY